MTRIHSDLIEQNIITCVGDNNAHEGPVEQLVFSNKFRLLASGGHQDVRIWSQCAIRKLDPLLIARAWNNRQSTSSQ